MNRIDLAIKIHIYDVMAEFIYLHRDVIRHLPVQTCFVYFSFSVRLASTNFGQAFLSI